MKSIKEFAKDWTRPLLKKPKTNLNKWITNLEKKVKSQSTKNQEDLNLWIILDIKVRWTNSILTWKAPRKHQSGMVLHLSNNLTTRYNHFTIMLKKIANQSVNIQEARLAESIRLWTKVSITLKEIWEWRRKRVLKLVLRQIVSNYLVMKCFLIRVGNFQWWKAGVYTKTKPIWSTLKAVCQWVFLQPLKMKDWSIWSKKKN